MDTFVDEVESVAKDVARSLYDEIVATVESLAPDGRGLFQELKSMDEQLEEYRIIRNDLAAWTLWAQNKATEIAGKLQVGGVGEETIQAIDPIRIAVAYMLDYSSKMEEQLENRMV